MIPVITQREKIVTVVNLCDLDQLVGHDRSVMRLARRKTGPPIGLERK
jgi:hypothetical protein